ncbi:MAG: hypothetical protein LBM69_08960 [Lachnospiraceae bacterium]|jgi:hypothetical protein|nr:hypothetical protein [Lachnospiraceae bacterium]
MNEMQDSISAKKKVVFLPYKASMWDSLESVWKQAAANSAIDAKVIPIPYFDKNPDGSFREMHYEGELFPDYVPIIPYQLYDFEKNHPDEIYIHNPYDECNTVTSVLPAFYSKNLKQYTDKLIYIPYFVLGEVDFNNRKNLEEMAHFAQIPAVIFADQVIVQSENMRKLYIESMVMMGGEKIRNIFEKKILVSGSPKVEKIRSMTLEDIRIPDTWNKYLYRTDGSKKKVVLYNTSISAFLQYSEQMLDKMERVFERFQSSQKDEVLLWRPHPLLKETIRSMRPQLLERYETVVEKYKQDDFGIYDDTADVDRAILLADVYYGDLSSLTVLCEAVQKPVIIQAIGHHEDLP